MIADSRRAAANYSNLVQRYVCAKDGNRPHLLKAVFGAGAVLDMQVASDAISFPAHSAGLEAITEVLVRNFSRSYENVYTFCFSDTLKLYGQKLGCRWLVVMNDRSDGSLRVGCGSYDWSFSGDERPLAEHLLISIDRMLELPAADSAALMGWAEQLSYPWCESVAAATTIPQGQLLRSMCCPTEA